MIIPIDLGVSWAASGFSPAVTKFNKDMGISEEVGTLGLSIFVLGLALGPMTLAPLSEYFGRSAIYIVSYGAFLFFLLGTALVQNLGGFLVLKLLSGLTSAVTIGIAISRYSLYRWHPPYTNTRPANFGGTIADLWPHNETGIPMSLFLWAATCGSPSGYFLLSFMAKYHGWRNVFWALLGLCGGFWVLMCLVLRETRHTTILRSRAKKVLKYDSDLETRDPDLRDKYAKVLQHRSTQELFAVALTRPFRFLFTEAIIIFAVLYNGYLYGLGFPFNTAFSLVFGPEGHGFETYRVRDVSGWAVVPGDRGWYHAWSCHKSVARTTLSTRYCGEIRRQ